MQTGLLRRSNAKCQGAILSQLHYAFARGLHATEVCLYFISSRDRPWMSDVLSEGT